MKRWFIVSIVLSLTAIGALAFWRWAPLSSAFFTDAGVIREPAETAKVRDVLWEPPQPIANPINVPGETYEPRLSNDGTTMYFVRGKAGQNADIFFARKTIQGWGEPQPVEGINSAADELGPEITADAGRIYFYSDRAGGSGGYDLWLSRRGEDGRWNEPANLGPAVNSPFNDYGPAISADGRTLYFSSNRPLPEDDKQPDVNAWPATLREQFFSRTYDLYVADVSESGAGPARPLTTLNTSWNEGAPAVSAFGDFLYFTSDRPGGAGGFDLYRSRRIGDIYEAADNLGAALNTTFHELDPALSMNGFGLAFSSDRPVEGQSPAAGREYKLFHSNSREVFKLQEHVDRAPIDWAALWRTIAPNLLWALVALALLLIMLLLFKGGQNRKLSLLTKCVLASLAAHLLLMVLFNVWEVAAGVAGEIKRGGGGGVIRVALAGDGGGGGGGIAAQLGGSFSQVEAPAVNLESSRASATFAIAAPESAELPLANTSLHFSHGRAVEPVVPQDSPSPSREIWIPEFSVQLEHDTAPSIALNIPSAQAATPTFESIVQVGAATFTAGRQDIALSAAPPASGAFQAALPSRALLPSSGTAAGSSAFFQNVPDAGMASGELHDAGPMAIPASMGATRGSVALNVSLPQQPVSSGSGVEASLSIPGGSRLATTRRANLSYDGFGGLPNQAGMTSVVPGPSRTMFGGGAGTGLATQISMGVNDSGGTGGMEGGHEPLGGGSMGLPHAILATGTSAGGNQLPLTMPVESNAYGGRKTSSGGARSGDLPLPAFGQTTAKRTWLGDGPAGASSAANLGSGPEFQPGRVSLKGMGTSTASLHGSGGGDAGVSLAKDSLPGGPGPLVGVALTPGAPTSEWGMDFELPSELAPPENPYPQRSAEDRLENVKRMGGSEATEATVKLALEWLARHQSTDGHWDADGFDRGCGACSGTTDVAADHALTGLGLLCFLGAGHTHAHPGPYRDNVQRALTWLVSRQTDDGDLRGGKETMYTHGIATIALAESYAMTADPSLADAVGRAARFIYRARSPHGGWRYDPGQAGDTSVLGWQVMALKSAARAGVPVPERAFDHARQWFDQVGEGPARGLYPYQPGEGPSPSMTAEGLFAQQLLGLTPDDPRNIESVEFVLKHLPKWNEQAPTYLWYYASLALFQHQGDAWRQWNTALSRELVAHQRREGKAAGSWDPTDEWSRLGGRVYQTALCTLMLEVYYRYLPMYGHEALADHSPLPAPPSEDEIIGTIRGTVRDKSTKSPLPSAQVRLVLSDRDTLTATTDESGKYSLDVPATPDFFALSASLDSYIPQTVNVERARLESKKKLTVNFALEPQTAHALVTEALPDVHHLGDDRFSGSINSQFQKASEGSAFSVAFQIDPQLLAPPPQRAEVRLLIKGVQRRHKLFINDQLLPRRLPDAPEDGSFGEFSAPIDPGLLKAGRNTLRVQALPSEDDIDDFEFVNIRIYLAPSEPRPAVESQ